MENLQQLETQNISAIPYSRSYSIPRKYDKLIHKTTQIPRVCILRLIEKMDQDNDGWITSDDIVKFSEKHYLFYSKELAKSMIDEALSKRIVAFKEEQLKEPINVDEILGAVQIHYTLDEEHRWVERKRPFWNEWVDLLKAAGEQLPVGHDLQKLTISKVQDMHELAPPPHKPKLNQSKSQGISIKKLIPKPEFSKDKPEAGLLLKRSQILLPVDTVPSKEVKEDSAFEKVINQKIRKVEGVEFPTMGFESKSYFKEAERISKEPKLSKTGRNPIYKFMPENLNYGVDPKSPKLSQQDLEEIRSLHSSMIPNKYKSQPVLLKNPYYGLTDSNYLSTQKDTHFGQFSQLGTLQPQPEQVEKQKPMFLATFKPENVETLKHRLARQKQKEKELLQDFYISPSSHKFRDEYVDSNKPLYKTRIKPDPLSNPHLMSEHDQRPQFTIEKELKMKEQEEMARQKLIDDYEGSFKQTKQWIKYFPTADLNHNFVDRKRPIFLDKGNYQEPGMILLQFLREGAGAEDNFQLFHRTLRTTDKHLFLGLQVDPNSQ